MGGGKPAIDAINLSLKCARVVSDAAKQVRIHPLEWTVGFGRRAVCSARRVGAVDGPSSAGAQCGWEGGVRHGLAAVLRREWTSENSRPMS